MLPPGHQEDELDAAVSVVVDDVPALCVVRVLLHDDHLQHCFPVNWLVQVSLLRFHERKDAANDWADSA